MKPTLISRDSKKKGPQDFDIKESNITLVRDQQGDDNKGTSYLHYHITQGAGAPCVTKLVERLTPAELKQRDNRRSKERLRQKQRNAAPREGVEVSEHLRPFINLWRQYGGQKHLNETTKAFSHGVRALRKLTGGIMFIDVSLPDNMKKWRKRHRFTLKEFETSLKNFHIAKTSLEHFPANKSNLKSMALHDFVYQTFVKDRYSPFLFYLENEPKPVVSSKDPKLTKLLISHYQENMLGISKYNPPLPEKRKFAVASDRLSEFFKENERNIAPGFPLDRPRMVRWLFEAIQRSINGFEDASITPGHLCSDLTFEQRLPTFLTDQAIFSDRNTII